MTALADHDATKRDERRAMSVASGFISDAIGLTGGVIVVAALVILTLPLALALRPAFAQLQSPSVV